MAELITTMRKIQDGFHLIGNFSISWIEAAILPWELLTAKGLGFTQAPSKPGKYVVCSTNEIHVMPWSIYR